MGEALPGLGERESARSYYPREQVQAFPVPAYGLGRYTADDSLMLAVNVLAVDFWLLNVPSAPI